MTNEMKPHDDLQIPPQLVSDLKRLHHLKLSVPAGIDAQMMAQARARFAGGRRLKLILALAAPGAIAASIALLVWIVWPQTAAPLHMNITAAASREDIDGNGRVDILDAFALARQIDYGGSTTTDLNGDGRVDRADVEVIAHAAVRLDRGTLQ